MKVLIRNGDSFWYYSQLFKVPLQLILDSNKSLDPTNLQIGIEIEIPGFEMMEYKVKFGDTFWKLAKSIAILPDGLSLMNPDVDPEHLAVDEIINIPTRIISPIVNANRPYDYQMMMDDIKKLHAIYPFIRCEVIGNSVLGNNIPEIQIGSGAKVVHINGSFHANEWITTNVIMKFLNDYLLALTNMSPIRGMSIQPFYFDTMLSIVPMVNPDGVDLVLNGPPEHEPHKSKVVEINEGSLHFQNWKANIRGVDLNNQFPAKWEIEKERKLPKSPSPRDYPGDAPLTEPEVNAMVKLTKERKFTRVLAFHTQGEEIYWGYEGLEPPNSQLIVNEFSRVSGYKAVRYVDSHAGYKDWFIQEWQQPGFTIELGEGVNPLPLTQFNEIYQESLGILLAGIYM
ncbi:M14 family metallopeptidase [Fredinandcohnia quinoae]|uniref:M14 family metallopeptidase n=1 Tax=Fredinandcohnia quinoae TaxID=2918902 RepID=A0AAW5E5N7_9BACI|nr:M14 family metallopeptidase [Fredinandcohnia sp. SECRCQ15]MCH1624925.1 M14 family metallopeptidase [Fredinandcohnia sp. SECRCQ15]